MKVRLGEWTLYAVAGLGLVASIVGLWALAVIAMALP
jgi:hypothetical protein